jgi:hypothetical protein
MGDVGLLVQGQRGAYCFAVAAFCVRQESANAIRKRTTRDFPNWTQRACLRLPVRTADQLVAGEKSPIR